MPKEFIEREHKFLALITDPVAAFGNVVGIGITQVYLNHYPEVRIRFAAFGPTTLTVKTGVGLRRVEVEKEITKDIAEEMISTIPSSRKTQILKTRYEIGRYEIDIFDDILKGLVIAEVELKEGETDTDLPTPPEGILLLDLFKYTNSHLSSIDTTSFVAESYREYSQHIASVALDKHYNTVAKWI